MIIKARRAAAKDAARGLHTLASHARKAGLDETLAGSVAGALRAKRTACGIQGKKAVMVRPTAAGAVPVKGARKYTKTEFKNLVKAYSPRAARFVEARELLLSY
jgi:hypothetical protein